MSHQAMGNQAPFMSFGTQPTTCFLIFFFFFCFAAFHSLFFSLLFFFPIPNISY